MQNQTIDKPCKFLGLQTDQRTLASYPSVMNTCYGCGPNAAPSLSQQSEVCLSGKYESCPIFSAGTAIKMPAELELKKTAPIQPQSSFLSTNAWILATILVVIAVFSIAIATFFIHPTPTTWTPPVTATASATTAPQQIEEATQDKTSMLLTETAQQTETPAPSPSPALEAKLLPLDTILGTSYKIIIHRVAEGDNLSLLAKHNETTENVIASATYNFIVPIQVDRLIVIPIKATAWDGQPALEPYEILQDEIGFDELGELLGVDAKLLKYFNGCENCLLQKGSWVVIPRAP